MAAKLLNQCELVKIELSRSDADSQDIIVRNFLRVEGPAQNLVASVSKEELEGVSSTIVARGLGRIDEILEQTRLTNQDIELCLATGGMVNMPAIRNGLTERFIGRVPKLNNSDRIIAEGAAWIANDDLRLILAKPIELLVADTSGSGTYYPLVPAGLELPVENLRRGRTRASRFESPPLHRRDFPGSEIARHFRNLCASGQGRELFARERLGDESCGVHRVEASPVSARYQSRICDPVHIRTLS
jgi:hypothetical protein